jgi:prepilin-type N-terminal cleavage/methylation domain-containing protein
MVRSRLFKPSTSVENPKRFQIYQGVKPLSGQEISLKSARLCREKLRKVWPGVADNIWVVSKIMRMELRMLNQKGFTLIEIITVLAIMSVLAAVRNAKNGVSL